MMDKATRLHRFVRASVFAISLIGLMGAGLGFTTYTVSMANDYVLKDVKIFQPITSCSISVD